jgi:copper chaperone CopZ
MAESTQQITLLAPDISCAHCVATVQETLQEIGVDQASADVESKQVSITFNPNRVTLDKIEAALDDAGYPVQRNAARP